MATAIVPRNHCLLCGFSKTKEVWTEKMQLSQFSSPVVSQLDGTVAHILQCQECQFAWVREIPSAEDFFMEMFSAPYSPLAYFNFKGRDGIYADLARELKLLGPVNGKLLDVGCASGKFMSIAHQAGLDAEGVELKNDSVQFIKQHLSLKAHRSEFLALDLPDASYDFITIIDCFAHFPDPIKTAQKARQLLKPGGWLVIKAPHFGAQLIKQKWLLGTGMQPRGLANHFFGLNHFNPTSIETCFRKARFGDVQVRPARSDFFVGNRKRDRLRNHLANLSNKALKISEKLTHKPVGLHFTAVGRKA